ncbi:uncharacterized protein [Pyrus communis]|uniref:uncharacterized protein isoform X1 n=2 Tax=Pyrus communis TaxID=23211 RepID=UPI0035C20444
MGRLDLMSQLITRRRGVANAPPAFSAPTASVVSAPLIGEPTPIIEATPKSSQVPASSTSSVSVQPLNAQSPYRRRRHPEPFDHTSSTSTVEGGGSQPAKKKSRGPNQMLKLTHTVRLSNELIKIAYDSRHRGAATSQQHSNIANSCGFFIRWHCPMQWESWAEIPERTKKLLRHELLVNYNLEDIPLEATAYLEENLATQYKHWKCELHAHFKKWDDPEIARLEGCPIELLERSEDWEWLCKHFTDTKFVKRSVVGKKAWETETLLHHFGSMPFSYRVDQKLGCRHGKVVRGMGKVQVRETSVSSSKSTTGQIIDLTEEVKILKDNIAAHKATWEAHKADWDALKADWDALKATWDALKAQTIALMGLINVQPPNLDASN